MNKFDLLFLTIASDQIRSKMLKHYKDMTPGEESSLNTYATDSSDINAYPYDKQDYKVGNKLLSKHVAHIDSAFGESRAPQELILHRNHGNFEFPSSSKGIKEGNVISHKGYLSTSLDESKIKPWEEFTSHTLHIKVPKGHPAIHLGGTPQGKEDNVDEVILPRDTKMKITKTYKIGKRKHADAEVT
jgi:hypothetical protein